MWLLIDAISKLGVPGDLAFDMILDLSDLPQKEELKRRYQARQESQAKAAQEEMQMKMQLEEIKNQNSHQSISFKDAPPAIQLAMAAQQGLAPPELAQHAMQLWIQQVFPDFAIQQELQQQQMQNIPPEPEQEISPEETDKMIAMSQMNQPPPQNKGRALTQPALESLLRGITPAM